MPHGHGVTSFSTCLVSLAPGWCLLNSSYTLYLCSVFLLEITLWNLWSKQLYSSTNKSNTYRRTSHVSSPIGNVNFLFLNLLSDIWGWQHLYRILSKKIVVNCQVLKRELFCLLFTLCVMGQCRAYLLFYLWDWVLSASHLEILRINLHFKSYLKVVFFSGWWCYHSPGGIIIVETHLLFGDFKFIVRHGHDSLQKTWYHEQEGRWSVFLE